MTCDALKLKIIGWTRTQICLNRGTETIRKFYDPNYPTKNLALKEIFKDFPQLNDYAMLCKKLTCLSPTRDRIKFAFSQFDACLKHLEKKQGQLTSCVDWTRTMNILQFMKMAHTFMKGWDESEFTIVLQKMDGSFQISAKLSKVIAFLSLKQLLLLLYERFLSDYECPKYP